ncbi:EbsA family protein [Furfurilactobacillus siliginis]|uniref:Pore-forming protein n=1 Tax=Furfurilactobacillus siliginis TaxID=348151 RepID=A0A0R2L692_9LACO|nr:EbsA family protein [Furfurilactobacillus siliginis]KRN96961.1 hypothetical protein IV55_GL000836 [Furfurilactobacillus siliginis]GEK27720.1 hypothetical protein LSI01_00310 [Furfurilactobacillus siliginis]
MTKHRFFYRPSGLTAIIVWSWTAIFFFGGVIFQYEMAKFNWPAIIIAGLFLLFLLWQFIGRQIIIDGQNLRIRRLLAHRSLVVNIQQLEQHTFTGHTWQFEVQGKHYALRLSKHALNTIEQLVNA